MTQKMKNITQERAIVVTSTNILAAVALAAAGASPAVAKTSDVVRSLLVEPSDADATTTQGSTQGDSAQGDIVVTARKVSERLQDVPLAISALTGDSLVQQGVKELRDLNARFPNVQINQANGGGAGVQLTIRGQSQANTGVLFVDPAVGVYVDGLVNARSFGLRTGLVDIERVEVLRGPQGTLYGRNTTGGAISIITKDPTSDLGGYAKLGYGNYDQWSAEGVLNIPLDDQLSLRLVATHSEHDAYGRQITTGRGIMDENSTYLRAKLKYETGPFTATLTSDYYRYKSSGPAIHISGLVNGSLTNVAAAVTPTSSNPTGRGTYTVLGGNLVRDVAAAAGLPYSASGLNQAAAIVAGYVRRGPGAADERFWDTFSSDPQSRADSKGGSATLNLDFELSSTLSLRSISGWRTLDRAEGLELDATPYDSYDSDQTIDGYNLYSQEVQLLGNMPRLKWVTGAYFSREKGHDLNISRSLPNISISQGVVAADTYGDVTSTNITRGIFAQGTYELNDKLNLTLGGRFSSETRKVFTRGRQVRAGMEICIQPVVLREDPAVCGIRLNKTYTDFSWLASLDYQVERDILVYAKAARGVRAGGHQGRANSNNVANYEPYDPETVTEYELGFKSLPLGNRLKLNLAAFYDDFSNAQRSITIRTVTTSFSLISNAAKARLYGFEGEARVKIVDGFSVGANVGYLNAKYKKFIDGVLGDRSNEEWPAPRWSYSVSGQYQMPTGFGSVEANLNWNFKGTQDFQPQSNFDSQVAQKSYGVLDGTLGVRLDKPDLNISFWGRNLLNKKYYTSGVSIESIGWNMLLTGEPRTYGIQVTKSL